MTSLCKVAQSGEFLLWLVCSALLKPFIDRRSLKGENIYGGPTHTQCTKGGKRGDLPARERVCNSTPVCERREREELPCKKDQYVPHAADS